MFSKKNTHGGKREGAGRPALFDKPMKRINLMLDEETRAIFRKLGNGDMSAGAREAARVAIKKASAAN